MSNKFFSLPSRIASLILALGLSAWGSNNSEDINDLEEIGLLGKGKSVAMYIHEVKNSFLPTA